MRDRIFNPLVSVIVPVYNIAPYLPKCINSIRNQIYQNIEIIIVDDGSTDETACLCDQFQMCDQRIKVLHKENGGTVSARKAGIVMADGEYATYVDGDDFIEQTMISEMVKNLQNGDVVICGVIREFGGNIRYVKNEIECGIYEGNSLNKLYQSMIHTGKLFERGILPYSYAKLYRTALLKRNQLEVPNEIRVGEDPACLYPALLEADKIVVMSECFYHYQIRNNSVMGTNEGKEIESCKIFYKYLKKKFQTFELKENLIEQLNYLTMFILLLRNMEVFQRRDDFLFPYGEIPNGAKIAVYGAGRFGHELVRYLKNVNRYSLVVWVDNNAGERISKPEVLTKTDYDYILIAVLMNETGKEIEKKLERMKIPHEKIRSVDEKEIDNLKDKMEEYLWSID